MAMAAYDDWQSGKTMAESTTFMFDNQIATDVTFKFPDRDEIKAHRFMLMARSHVFFTMFHSELDKPGEAIEIPDIEPAIFSQFLRFLYLDDTKLSTITALQLTYCAEKYGVKSLKGQCMRFLLEQVNETTWAEILDHAVFYNEESLTQTCLHFLKSYKSLQVKGLEEYHISRETLQVIMDYEELSVREVDILKFCQTWAEQECKKKEAPVNMTNKRKMLGTLVRKIPFCSMKQEEFVAEVSGRHFLNGQEELQIFRYLCAADKANPPFPCMKQREPKDEPVSVKLPAVKDSGYSGMKLREAKDEQVLVKLPDVWDVDYSGHYFFSIRCSQSFALIGLTFTQPGDFNIWLGHILEHIYVQPGCLTVYLQEAVHCKAGTELRVTDRGLFLPEVKGNFPFSCEVKSHDSSLYKKLDFVITKYNNCCNKPPFDTLIVRLWERCIKMQENY